MGHHQPNAPARKARQIRHRLANLRLDECNIQARCRLFTRLPTEIRLMVFEYALAEHEDHNAPRDCIPDHELRPGNIWQTRIHTKLLLTCRRVYLEASHMPMQSATITTFKGPRAYDAQGPPPPFGSRFDLKKLQVLTACNLRNLQRISMTGPLSRDDVKFLECRRDELRLKVLNVHISPTSAKFDNVTLWRPFGVSVSSHRDTEALLDQQVRGLHFQLVAPEPDSWGYRTDKNFILPRTLQELNIYLETRITDREMLTRFLVENGTQIAPLYRGGWLSTSNNPIAWTSRYKFASPKDKTAKRLLYDGDDDFADYMKGQQLAQYCCARIKYTKQTQIPRWADFDGVLSLDDMDNPDPEQLNLIVKLANPKENPSLKDYLEASAKFHNVESVVGRADGEHECSQAVWWRQLQILRARDKAIDRARLMAYYKSSPYI